LHILDKVRTFEHVTGLQKLFCEHYVGNGCRNAQEAARTAGYKEGKNLHVRVAELFRKPAVKEYIQKLVRESLSNLDEMKLKWISETVALAFSEETDITDVVNVVESEPDEEGRVWKSVDANPTKELPKKVRLGIEEISQTKDGIRIKMKNNRTSQTAALAMLQKFLGLDGDPSREVPNEKGETMSREDRMNRILELKKQLGI
jgi:phage terminase small subunit